MPNKHLLSLGFTFPGDVVETVSFASTRAFVDADIIVIDPALYGAERNADGDIVVTGDVSKHLFHWGRELSHALENGKTIYVFMTKPVDVYRPHDYMPGLVSSGTTYNYLFPADMPALTVSSGSKILPTKNTRLIQTYWNGFAENTTYQVYFELNGNSALLTARDPKRIVAGVVKAKQGHLVLLPPVDFDFLEVSPFDEEHEEQLRSEALRYGNGLVSAFVEIDRTLRSGGDTTPQPDWVSDVKFVIESETRLLIDIEEVNRQLLALNQKHQVLLAELESEGSIRRLLYETGHPLEYAILDALTLLGFHAEQFADAESEFDAVFVSPEGRFLGEAEGRDNAPINIDKLRQLKDNLDTDYARDEISEYAKGVLFGNAYRLAELNEREEFFTQKCKSSAKQAGIALVRTPDLFVVAKYLKENSNMEFATDCRLAIKNAVGEVVVFPAIPQPEA